MSFRHILCPSLGRTLSNVMVQPSSAEAQTDGLGLDEYQTLGGNALHLHGEGGETHSRRAAGAWLRRSGERSHVFVCAAICHDDWDEAAQRPIDRFTPAAVHDDIATDLALLGTEYLDLVYFSDHPDAPFEPIIDALAREIASGRIRAFGVSQWSAPRLVAAQQYAQSRALPGIAAVFTTELSLAHSVQPLWPEYISFDAALASTIRQFGVTVFAHALDLNIGQCLFGDEDALARLRPSWVRRWQHPANAALVPRVREFAAAHGITPREVSLAWMLNQDFPVSVIVSTPSPFLHRASSFERASHLSLAAADLQALRRLSSIT